jgi:hypothetical protein
MSAVPVGWAGSSQSILSRSWDGVGKLQEIQDHRDTRWLQSAERRRLHEKFL